MENPLGSPDSLLASFFSERKPNRLLLITGSSGSGKTSFCARLVTLAGDAGLSVGGILCPAVFENGEKIGIDQVDIASGERRRLGVRSSGSHVSSIGHWYLDESVFEWGNDLIAALSDEDLIVIDELGPLEFEKGKGYQQALGLLDEGRYKLALVVVRPAILSLAQLRWPGAQSFSLEGVVR